MFESFYTYLHGPRTFWGGSNKTIVNNYFGAPPMMSQCSMFSPQMCGMPMFGMQMPTMSLFGGFGMNFGMGCNCNNGMNDIFGYMLMNQMLNNSAASLGKAIASGRGGHKTNNTTNDNNSNRLQNLESELAAAKKQIEDLKKEKAEAKKAKDTTSKKDVDDTTNNKKTGNDETTNKTNKPETLDDKLNKLDGYKDLTPEQQNYVKERIKSQKTDENGKTTYNISAISHSGDTFDKIINRFYQQGENHDGTNIPQSDFNTQTSGQTKKYPNVGEDITLNNVSDFGLNALAQEAKQNITKDTEIEKTNKEMNKLKEEFLNGTHKLSKEYVLQNHMMSETKYNETINNKYNN